MIQLGTRIKVTDNSGAKEVSVIRILKGMFKRFGEVGDIFVGSVKSAIPDGLVKKHQVVYGVIVRTKKEKRRKTGEYIRFDDNAGVLIDIKTKEPIGTAVFGPIAREVKERGFTKIASLAPEIL
jgi:large subunit ribosomal protein L14|uniref:Large ribosomal subunit protein uL14 n=1 Tax=candidate division CPR3 bacterium TaxID=2268181 RepID=A0A7C5URC2_UNCC3